MPNRYVAKVFIIVSIFVMSNALHALDRHCLDCMAANKVPETLSILPPPKPPPKLRKTLPILRVHPPIFFLPAPAEEKDSRKKDCDGCITPPPTVEDEEDSRENDCGSYVILGSVDTILS